MEYFTAEEEAIIKKAFRNNADAVMRKFPKLPQAEQEAIKYYLGISDGQRHTLSESAEKFGIKRERLWRVIKNLTPACTLNRRVSLKDLLD